MKLRTVPASTGLQWVRLGVKTFLRQPLAMSGLFFMFMATASVLSLIPLLGTAVSVASSRRGTVRITSCVAPGISSRPP